MVCYYKVRQLCYYKVRQVLLQSATVLQSVTILLQSATGTTKLTVDVKLNQDSIKRRVNWTYLE